MEGRQRLSTELPSVACECEEGLRRVPSSGTGTSTVGSPGIRGSRRSRVVCCLAAAAFVGMGGFALRPERAAAKPDCLERRLMNRLTRKRTFAESDGPDSGLGSLRTPSGSESEFELAEKLLLQEAEDQGWLTMVCTDEAFEAPDAPEQIAIKKANQGAEHIRKMVANPLPPIGQFPSYDAWYLHHLDDRTKKLKLLGKLLATDFSCLGQAKEKAVLDNFKEVLDRYPVSVWLAGEPETFPEWEKIHKEWEFKDEDGRRFWRRKVMFGQPVPATNRETW